MIDREKIIRDIIKKREPEDIKRISGFFFT